jgi:BNR repeat-like domain
MNRTFLRSRDGGNTFAFLTLVLAFAVALVMVIPAHAQSNLVKLSTDTFNNSDSEHKTEVEPDTFAFGSTIVSAFQVARVPDGGGADVGFATSTDGGKTWTSGYLPGLTDHYKGGSFTAASDAAVAYDAKHGQWLISTLPITNNQGEAVATSRSADGIHWGKPVIVDQSGSDDKNWITCDNTKTSPHYGNCYTEWDEPGQGDLIFMSTSTDGGKTWGPAKNTADSASGLGGQPLVQPNGTVVVPIDGFGGMIAFSSTDGGKSWSSTSFIANQNFRGEDGGLRSPGLPSAAVDGAGKIYVVWPDCSFRSGCSTDDIVLSTSTNGKTWTTPTRIPIDPIKSTVDHFIPGLGVDLATSGKTAHLALTYYYYPVASCNNSCQLEVGFTISQDGGKTWTTGKKLAGPMQLSWLPQSQNGLMVADYLAVAYSKGNPFGVFAVAKAPSGGLFNEAMYTTKAPLLASADEPRFSSKGEKPVPNAKGKYVWKYYDDDGEYPIPPSKQIRPMKQK